jgi:hypothetical protein
MFGRRAVARGPSAEAGVAIAAAPRADVSFSGIP